MEKPAFLGRELKGAQKILTVYEDRISLKQMKNFRSFVTSDLFKGTKEIQYSNMTGIQYRECSKYVLGFIQFETASTSSDNFGSENSWTFNAEYNELSKNIVDYIRKRISESKNGGVVVQQKSAADEILKFKQLLDAGIITQDEFEAKKKELLGL